MLFQLGGKIKMICKQYERFSYKCIKCVFQDRLIIHDFFFFEERVNRFSKINEC